MDTAPIRTANGFQQRPIESQMREEDLPPQVSQLVDWSNKDRSYYVGDPRNVTQPSFGKAIGGIENGDYEGLEMLDFGALADGTPAVSFLDEDGQRQTIRMTVPQWVGAMEYRSKARTELAQQRDLEARREAFKPYFNAMSRKVGATNDPDIGGYLAAMYQMDPKIALDQLGEFQRQQMKQDADTVEWRGKAVPIKFAQQAIKMEQDEYEQGERAFDSAMKAYEDQPYAAPLIENIRALRRKPSDYAAPSTMTLIDSLASQNSGPLPLVSLFHAMTKPMMTPLPQPAILPRRDQNGEYNMAEVTNFLNNFNMVSQRLGWDQVTAADEVGLSTIIDALDIANNSQGLASKVSPPPQRKIPVSIERQQMANESAMARDRMRYGGAAEGETAGASQQDAASDEQALSEAVGAVSLNPQESPKEAMKRILSLGEDPTRLEASTMYTPEQKAAIRRAAQIIRQYMNK